MLEVHVRNVFVIVKYLRHPTEIFIVNPCTPIHKYCGSTMEILVRSAFPFIKNIGHFTCKSQNNKRKHKTFGRHTALV